MEQILQWVLMSLGVIGVGIFLGKIINRWISGLFVKFRVFLNQSISTIVKDPEIRKLAYSAILYAQKSFADLSGEGRLKKAIEILQKLIPGKFDDEIIALIVQNFYDELVKPVQ